MTDDAKIAVLRVILGLARSPFPLPMMVKSGDAIDDAFSVITALAEQTIDDYARVVVGDFTEIGVRLARHRVSLKNLADVLGELGQPKRK